MNLFHRRKENKSRLPYSPEEYEPVLNCSICTGEQVACMRNRETGQLREIMLIRDEGDLTEFRRLCGVGDTEIRKVY